MTDHHTDDSEAKWAILAALMVVPSYAWIGLVVSILWRWFAVPLGVGSVGAWWGAGLALLVGILTPESRPEKPTREWFERTLGQAALLPLVFLVIGWVFHMAMVAGGAP